jgi:NAD(P)-dependent dehydrogenase (short-subunit alcohol dehydrogenase family)
MLLERKVAMVTGAGAGIGRASALAFAREGAAVMVVDVNAEGARETAQAIEREGGRALVAVRDISDATDVAECVRRTVTEFGGLHCAHNNAGVEDPVGLTHELDEAGWDRVLGVDLRGTWLCIKHQAAHMLEHGGGSIVNTASVLSHVAQQRVPAYVSAKHGVLGLTRVAALDYADRGIRVNSVSPGVIDTALVQRTIEAGAMTAAQYAALQPMGRMGRPEEVAGAAVWLCSNRASFITGADLAVDGGFLVR